MEIEEMKEHEVKKANRRVHPRKKVLIAVDYAKDKESISDRMLDISEGGVFIATKKPLPVGTDATLAFTMPNSDTPIKIEARVVWTCKKGMGLGFKEVDELTKERIESFLF